MFTVRLLEATSVSSVRDHRSTVHSFVTDLELLDQLRVESQNRDDSASLFLSDANYPSKPSPHYKESQQGQDLLY